jgi:hypothetical protein
LPGRLAPAGREQQAGKADSRTPGEIGQGRQQGTAGSMSDRELRYDLMVEEALRSVVRQALEHVARHGLSGEHHFYITFATGEPGLEISETLRARYPEEMTIVLQHRFWDLKVEAERFSVTLTFDGQPERLSIPYVAVTAFADPSVRFGLQFNGDVVLDEDSEAMLDEVEDGSEAETAENEAGQVSPSPYVQEAPAHDSDEDGDEKVVTLDRFRRKT